MGSQEEQSGADEPESQAVVTAPAPCADYEPVVADVAPQPQSDPEEEEESPNQIQEPVVDDADDEEPPEVEAEPEKDESDQEEEPEPDRYGETEEADIEDADVDEDQELDNSPPIPSPAVISPIGEAPRSMDRCSSNSDEPPPMLTAELPMEPLNTSVFNFTEDEEPPPPLHMSMNGSPRKIKIPRFVFL